jgi:hypothetical protein
VTVCDAGSSGDGLDIIDFSAGKNGVKLRNIKSVDEAMRCVGWEENHSRCSHVVSLSQKIQVF